MSDLFNMNKGQPLIGPRSRRIAGKEEALPMDGSTPLPAEPGTEGAGLNRSLVRSKTIRGCVGREDQLVPGGSVEHPLPVSALERVISRDKRFEGIGPQRASALRGAFGDDLHRVLMAIALGEGEEGDRAVIYRILPEKAVDKLMHVYPEMVAELDFAQWLDDLGVDPCLAAKVVNIWGEAGAELIKANPFLLVGWAGWKQVARIARAMGITPNDQRWQVGAVEAVLYQGLEQKHTVMQGKMLRQAIIKLIGPDADPVAAAQAALDDAGAALWGNGLQPVGAACMEAYCAERIKDIAGQSAQIDLVATEIMPDQVTNFIETYNAAAEWPLTDRQCEAIYMAVTNRLSLLAGYAGAGKTTVLRAIADLAETYGRELHLMALSGRAAKRISEATDRPASTIARFLKSFDGDFTALGPESLVIIDEASMVDLPTFYWILRRLGQGNLLLVGDPAQLPPIGFGLVFHTLIETGMVPRTMLDKVLRQTDASGIPVIAKSIRTGMLPDLKQFDGQMPGVSFIPCPAVDAVQCIMDIGKEITTVKGNTQIISPIKAGDAGIEAINRTFSQWRDEMRGEERDRFPGRPDIKVGDPVIWTRNDYDRDLQNGSMGRYLELLPDGKAVVELDGETFKMTYHDADCLDLAYAISVHKAQGSQWDRVIIPVFQSRILDRALIYTAITRAAEQVVLIGDMESIKVGIDHVASDIRKITLGQRLDTK